MQGAFGHHSGWTGVSTLNLKTLCTSTASCLVGSLIVIYHIEAAACCYKKIDPLYECNTDFARLLADTLTRNNFVYLYFIIYTGSFFIKHTKTFFP